MSLKNFQYDALMRNYNQNSFCTSISRTSGLDRQKPGFHALEKSAGKSPDLAFKGASAFRRPKERTLTCLKIQKLSRKKQSFCEQTDILLTIWICIMTVLFVRIPDISETKNALVSGKRQ